MSGGVIYSRIIINNCLHTRKVLTFYNFLGILTYLSTNFNTMVIAKKYVVNSPFRGMPKKSDFTIVEEELPGLNENGKHFLDVYPQGH